MEHNTAFPVTANPTLLNKKKKSNKKKQQNSVQQHPSSSRPSTSSGLEEAEDGGSSGNSKVLDEKKYGSSSPTAANGKSPVTNGWATQHVHNDNTDTNTGNDAAGLQDELAKEKTRSQVFEQQVASLRRDLIQKSRSMEAAVSAGQEQLVKEKARSQALEGSIQELNLGVSQNDITTANDTVARGKLQELEEQLFAQRRETDDLRNYLEGEKVERGNERREADHRLAKVQEEKQQLDTQYKTLLGRVAHIKTTLGDKLKSDAEELDRTRNMVAQLEEENRSLNQTITVLQVELGNANQESDNASHELSTLRNRTTLSHENWLKERSDITNAEKYAREDYEAARQAMQEWEVIATEERAVRESTGDRVIELEEQLANQQAMYDKVLAERDRESNTVNGLQRALQDIQNARKVELREVVEGMEAQINELTSKGRVLKQRSKEAETQLLTVHQDLERVLPFEREVKEKNLLIGKLRHEAVTLNDHLRKALRMLKRDNADDKIDKQLVTNVFLQFVSIQRGDSRKYEILQLIASVLDWNDEQREKAGLVRPGTAANSQTSFLKTPPLSPFHRSPSTPTLSDAYEGSKDIWTSVLDSEK